MERASIVKKVAQVDALAERIKEAKTAVLFEYKGLTVDQFNELRGRLREAGSEVKVYKNNIAKRASIQAGFEELADSFVGPKAFILGFDDVVEPAKVISEFAKEFKVVVVDGGIVEGRVVSKEDISAIANLPSRETLLTQLAAGLLMPVREVAIGLNMLTEQQEAN